MRRWLFATLALLLAAPAAAQTRWVMATAYAEANFHTVNIRQFIAEVEAASGGRLTIQLHPNASLLPLPQIKRAVQTGQIQLGEILLSAYANEDPFLEVDGIPFLAYTWSQADALQAASEPFVRARFERQGLVPLYYVHWDAQGFYTRTPLASVAELRGTRFRAYNNATSRMAELMGATPVTVQSAEVAQAFATNVVQSMFTSAQTGVAVSAWDYARVWTNVEGMRVRNAVVANARALAALEPPLREAITAAAARATMRGRTLAQEAETRMAERLRERGVQTPAPPEALMAELRGIGEQMTREWAGRAGADGEAMLARYRAAAN